MNLLNDRKWIIDIEYYMKILWKNNWNGHKIQLEKRKQSNMNNVKNPIRFKNKIQIRNPIWNM